MKGGLGRALGSLGLALAGIAAALVLSEAAARFVDGQPLFAWRLRPQRPTPEPVKRLDPTIGGGGLPPDVDPAWIGTSPPPLPRGRVNRDLLKHGAEADALGVQRFELFRIWNRNFVAKLGCQPGSPFQRWPVPLLVFDPHEPTIDPPYRRMASVALPGGGVTNRYGWRGPDIPVDKPQGTIRIAFVGASTTAGLPSLPFSYPEYVVHWLNLWADRAALPVRFDGINAGREGIVAPGIAAVIRQELLPMEPDLVVYYEGANDSLCARRLGHSTFAPESRRSRALGLMWRAVEATRDRLVLMRRLQGLLLQVDARGGRELEKPHRDWAFPTGLDEEHPDPDGPALPDHLKARVSALDSARAPLEAAGGELAISSFVFLVYDGLRVDVRRKPAVYRYLNEHCWPVTYADLRRDVDLGNHLLAAYAARRGLPYIDVARAFPPDLDLFFDAVHLNDAGTRAHAWIVFRSLLPMARSRLASGAWPRPDREKRAEHPEIDPGRPYTLSCGTSDR